MFFTFYVFYIFMFLHVYVFTFLRFYVFMFLHFYVFTSKSRIQKPKSQTQKLFKFCPRMDGRTDGRNPTLLGLDGFGIRMPTFGGVCFLTFFDWVSHLAVGNGWENWDVVVGVGGGVVVGKYSEDSVVRRA